MKTTTQRFLAVLALIAFIVYGCAKTTDYDNPVNPQNGSSSNLTPHVYGVLPTTPDMVIGVPEYSQGLFVSKVSTSDASYTLATPAVRDQGQIGSCTAFCGAETDEILYYYKNNAWPEILSPAFLYYCERVLILKQKITADNGASMVNIPQALQKYGICKEVTYAYPSSNKSTAYKTAPKTAAFTEGLNYRIGQVKTSYGVIAQGDVTAVKNLLAANVPVMMGFQVYDNTAYAYFERLSTTSYIYNPLTSTGALATGVKLLGGHAVPIIGWDDNVGGGSFLVQNSWGTAWGLNGFFYMPYTVFKSTKIVPTNNCYYAYLN
jgi:C1A family cysteine protease